MPPLVHQSSLKTLTWTAATIYFPEIALAVIRDFLISKSSYFSEIFNFTDLLTSSLYVAFNSLFLSPSL